MRINADFSQHVRVDIHERDYIASPQAGVDRLMLDRIGDEVARATSVVRYAPGSTFAEHHHAKGEEFLVLDGVFSDEHGDYEPGCYVRNPPGSHHAPFSTDGCRIFVKLRQFADDDLEPVVIDTRAQAQWIGNGSGRQILLHNHGTERVEMHQLPGGAEINLQVPQGGLECLLLEGRCRFGEQVVDAESWLRWPAGQALQIIALDECLIWSKQGHLPPL